MDWVEKQLKKIDERETLVKDLMAMRIYRGTKEHAKRMQQLRERINNS